MTLSKKSCLALGGGTVALGYLGVSLWLCGLILIPSIVFVSVLFGTENQKKRKKRSF